MLHSFRILGLQGIYCHFSPVPVLVRVYANGCPLILTLNSDRGGCKLKKKLGKNFGSRQFFAKGQNFVTGSKKNEIKKCLYQIIFDHFKNIEQNFFCCATTRF